MVTTRFQPHSLLLIITIFFISLYAGLFALSVASAALYIFSAFILIKNRNKPMPFIRGLGIYYALILFPFALILSDVISNGFNLEVILNIFNKFLPFIFIPILFIAKHQYFRVNRFKVLQAYYYISVLAVTYCILYAIFRGYLLNSLVINYWYFSYNTFAESVHLHSIYLAIFLTIANFSGIYLLYFKKLSLTRFSICNGLLFLGIILLSSRTVLFASIIGSILMYFILFKVEWKVILTLVIVFFMGLMIAYSNPIIFNRYSSVLKSSSFYSGTQLRLEIWKCAITVTDEKNFILGTGYSKTQQELNACYRENKLITPFKQKYHAHNQYLQLALYLGIIGVCGYFLILLYSIKIAYSRPKTHALLISFMLLMALVSFTESIFERMWGRLIFSFFLSFLLCIEPSLKKPED